MKHFIIALLPVAGLLYAVWFYANLPIVYESYTTKRCVEVFDPSGHSTCASPPKRFIHKWRY